MRAGTTLLIHESPNAYHNIEHTIGTETSNEGNVEKIKKLLFRLHESC